MEKRSKKTLARTLVCGTLVTKLLTIAALFVPSFLTFQQLSERSHKPTLIVLANAVQAPPKVRPRELVRIYAIVKSYRPDIADAEAWQVAKVILEESAKRKLDALLVSALIQVESGFRYSAVSASGARGLMQIMPETGRELTHALRRELGLRPAAFKPEWLDDPLVNIRLGVYYLHDLKKQFRDLTLALTAYNFGPSEIRNRLDDKLDFTFEFAGSVLDAYRSYLKAKQPSF